MASVNYQPRLVSTGVRDSKYYNSLDYFDLPARGNGNCTWYAYGRFREVQAETGNASGSSTIAPINPRINYKNPGDNNAGRWRFSVTAGLATGSEPELGAVLVIYDPAQPQHSTALERKGWQYVNWKPGHVLVVEKKNSNSEWVCSESCYTKSGGIPFRTVKIHKHEGKGWLPDWCVSARPTYKEWKFIYNPAVHGSKIGNSETGTGGQPSDPEPTTQKYIKYIYKPKSDTGPYKGMTASDMRNNGLYVYLYLRDKGWKIKPICAVLGYLQYHSKFSPVYLIGETPLHVSGGLMPDDEGQGYGMFTWSPSRRLIDYLEQNDYKIGMVDDGSGFIRNYDFKNENDAYGQLDFFSQHTREGIDWKETTSYYEPFINFSTDVQSLTGHSTTWLTRCFIDSWVGLDVFIDENAKLFMIDYAKSWEDYIRGNEIADNYSIAPGTGNKDDDDTDPQPVYPNYDPDEGDDEPYINVGNYHKPDNKHLLVARRQTPPYLY